MNSCSSFHESWGGAVQIVLKVQAISICGLSFPLLLPEEEGLDMKSIQPCSSGHFRSGDIP